MTYTPNLTDKTMATKTKCYYSVASFMRKDRANTRVSISFTVETSGEHFPLMGCIKYVLDKYKDMVDTSTVIIDSVFEISKEDSDNFREWINNIND